MSREPGKVYIKN